MMKREANVKRPRRRKERGAIVANMVRPIAALLLALPLIAAEKRPVTIADVTATRTPRAGSGPIVWAPDGKRFAFRERNSIWLYDVPSGLRKEIVSLTLLGEKAVKPAPAEIFEWQNRRVA